MIRPDPPRSAFGMASKEPHPIDPSKAKGGKGDPDDYLKGHEAGKKAGESGKGGKRFATDGDTSIGGRGHCREPAIAIGVTLALVLFPLALPLVVFLAVSMWLARPADGEHLGKRHTDARHREGDWHSDRDADYTPGQQGGFPGGRRPPLQDNIEETR